jgi:hypothetical protein
MSGFVAEFLDIVIKPRSIREETHFVGSAFDRTGTRPVCAIGAANSTDCALRAVARGAG